MNLLKFYKDCMRTGRLKGAGLCNSLHFEERVVLKEILSPTGKSYTDLYCWGYDPDENKRLVNSLDEVLHSFTPLRQTLVLLLNEIMKDLKKEKQ